MTDTQFLFLRLLRVAMGKADSGGPVDKVDWPALTGLAMRQGVGPIVCDGLQRLRAQNLLTERPDLQLLATVVQQEQAYRQQERTMRHLAAFYKKRNIRMMVIKGWGLSLDYPIPAHRYCCDMDIYLFGDQKRGDEAIREKFGVKIDTGHHNHSVFAVDGVTVENHYDFVNVHSHWSSKKVDRWLKEESKNAIEQDGIWLPSAQFNALYVLRHTACHFAAQEITLRHVLDWATFVERHHDEVDWTLHWQQCKELNMHRFLLALNNICVKHLGYSSDLFKMGDDSALSDKVLHEILLPEWQGRSGKGVVRYVYSRFNKWWTNRWKHRIVYPESLTATFFQQALSHLRKPATLKN